MSISTVLLEKQKKYLSHFFKHFDTKKMDVIIDIINKCKEDRGNIIVTGVGKSENISQHLVSLLNSISYTSINLSPINCLHGDIGKIRKEDLVLLFSNSGNTMELINITPFLKEKNAKIIGIFSNKNAKLIKYCNYSMVLPKLEELDRFKLIPTSSILSFVIFSNILVSSLIELDDIKIEEYGKNHPSGNIGKKVLFKCKDVMMKLDDAVLVTEDMKLQDCLLEICSKRLRCALVIDKNDKNIFLGIVTDGDIRRYLSQNSLESGIVSNCINREPKTVDCNTSLAEIANIIKLDYRIVSGIPVTENGNIVGLLTQEDIIRNIL